MTDTKHLEQKRGTWWVQVSVPPEVRPQIGKAKLSKSLQTKVLREAQARRHAVIAEFRAQIEAARNEATDDGDTWIIGFAERWRRQYLSVKEDPERFERFTDELSDDLDLHFPERADDETPVRSAIVEQVKARIFGDFVDLKETADRWIAETGKTLKPSTLAAREQHLQVLFDFLGPNTNMHDVNRRKAGQLVTKLTDQGLTAKTIRTGYLTTYHTFWKWVISRGLLDKDGQSIDPTNPWAGHEVKGAAKSIKRRPWRPDELVELLEHDFNGTRNYKHILPDLVRLALLTGCRIEELCDARPEHVIREKLPDGSPALSLFIPEGKTEAATRTIPLHPLAVPIIERRLALKSEWLFPGLIPAGKGLSRSHHPSKAFGREIRRIGFTDPALVFHSLRHSFTTALEGAGVPLSTAELLVGHKRASMTYGRYGDGSSVDLRTAIDKLNFGPTVMTNLSR